ncbi:MAG: FtsX-like permease family protein [Hyphomicrobiaceae bacterium]
MTIGVEASSIAVSGPPSRSSTGRIARLALAELARSMRGFWILIACIALGVAVIAGIGALSDGVRAGLERQGVELLGGDVTLSRPHRRATSAERSWLDRQGRVSETATLRSMGRRTDGSDQTLVEIKAVDDAYPLTGAMRLKPGSPAIKSVAAQSGAIVDPILLERLGLKIGDDIALGNQKVKITAALAERGEPDKIADRFTVGPRVFVSLATLEKTGLAGPGSLVRWRYAIDLPGTPDAEALTAFRDRVKADLPDAGFGVRDRTNPSPNLTRTLDRLRQFLTLIGLASLMIGGVGVANAVAAYVDKRRKTIATMRSLGASSRQIFTLHLIQVLALAGLGVIVGLAVGVLLPIAFNRTIATVLPIEISLTAKPTTILLSAAYGFLVALLFSLWPLGRAARVRAATLFRDQIADHTVRPAWPVMAATVAIGVTLAALAILGSESRALAAYFCAGLGAVFMIFPALGTALAWLARRLPRPRRPELALALGAIGAPGGLTRSVVLSLGAGLSLLTTVALIDAGIVRELQSRLPANAPDYFLVDIPPAERAALENFITRRVPDAVTRMAPMLRGRLVMLNGRPVEQIKAPPEAQWVLRGDRGLTYAPTIPEGSRVVAGSWWAPDYQGDPLVSFDAELARHLGLALGDTVTVNVLGRNVKARIANLREVDWESLGINFVMVFSPNVLQGAPHNFLATVALPKSIDLKQEAELSRAMGRAHPAITIIRVKDAIAAFNDVFSKIMTAVRIAGSVTLLAGALVLAGALATAQQRRIKLAVIMKTLGGTRRQILTMHLVEYITLALATAAVAVAIGSLAAWSVLTLLMKLPFEFSLAAVAQALALSIGLVVALGLLGTRNVLRAPSVPHLRAE